MTSVSAISSANSFAAIWGALNRVAAAQRTAPTTATTAKKPTGKAALLSSTAVSSSTPVSQVYYSSQIVVFDPVSGQYVIEYRNQLTGEETWQTPLHAAEEYQHTQQAVIAQNTAHVMNAQVG